MIIMHSFRIFQIQFTHSAGLAATDFDISYGFHKRQKQIVQNHIETTEE